jgi:predicted transcriptional regulator
MIREILAEMRRGSTTVRKLSRKLKIEKTALEGMLRYMVRKGLIRELYPQCRPKGCLGCPYHGKCSDMPVVGYEIVPQADVPVSE